MLPLAGCALHREDKNENDAMGSAAEAGAAPASGGAGTGNAGKGGSVGGVAGGSNGGGGSSALAGAGGGSSAGVGGNGAKGGEAGSTSGAGATGGSGAGTGGAESGSGGSAGTGATATCGNGIAERGEECDDGDDVPSDGCTNCFVDNGWTCNGSSECTANHPSCWGLQNICQGYSCCEDPLLTEGIFTQGDGTEEAFRNHLSPYRLDMFEVTVARFRNFVDDYEDWRSRGNPRDGAGEHPHIPGSGWDARVAVYTSAEQLRSRYMNCDGLSAFGTWVDDTGNDTLPMNCVDWDIAFLFCVWDGGRLPTESEWEYAAVGGDNQYLYAWGDDPVLGNSADYNTDYAVYDCMGDGSGPEDCAFTDILPVGSRRPGQALWDHYDLNGSMSEWLLDAYAHYPTLDQTDYANLEEPLERVIRGGGFKEPGTPWQTSIYRQHSVSAFSDDSLGFRCARSP